MSGPPGYTAQWTDGKARLAPWTQSNIHEGQLQDPGLPQEHQFSVPALVKRSYQERLESMTKRLIHTPEDQQRRLLEEIATDFWKQGMPVTTDALRKAAATIMNGAAGRQLTLSNRTTGRK